jgi:hypothetical protein
MHGAVRGKKDKCIQRFGGTPDGKRPLVRNSHRWGNNIKCICKKWDVGHRLEYLVKIGTGGGCM